MAASRAAQLGRQQMLSSSQPVLLPQAGNTASTFIHGVPSAQKIEENDPAFNIHAVPYSQLSEETEEPCHDEQIVSAGGPAAIQSHMSGDTMAAGLEALGQINLSDQPASDEEHDDLLLSYEQEYNQPGAASSADVLLP